MNVPHMLKESLIELDRAKPVIKYLQKNAKLTLESFDNDYQRRKFFFRDKNNRLILETEIEILAIYYKKLKVWCWAWSQPTLKNSQNYLSKEILLYGLKLEPSLSYIKSILTVSRGVIKDEIQIDINLAIASSIIKQPYVYTYTFPVEDSSLVFYVVMLNRTDLDILKNKLGDTN